MELDINHLNVVETCRLKWMTGFIMNGLLQPKKIRQILSQMNRAAFLNHEYYPKHSGQRSKTRENSFKVTYAREILGKWALNDCLME